MRKLFSAPYLWSRRPFANIASICGDWFITLPCNLWRYLPWLLHDADFDWGFLGEVMEVKLRAMSERFSDAKIVESWEMMASETKEAADILARMRDEDSILSRHGYDRYESFTGDEKREMWQRVSADQEVDRKRFGELMSRIQCWWD